MLNLNPAPSHTQTHTASPHEPIDLPVQLLPYIRKGEIPLGLLPVQRQHRVTVLAVQLQPQEMYRGSRTQHGTARPRAVGVVLSSIEC